MKQLVTFWLLYRQHIDARKCPCCTSLQSSRNAMSSLRGPHLTHLFWRAPLSLVIGLFQISRVFARKCAPNSSQNFCGSRKGHFSSVAALRTRLSDRRHTTATAQLSVLYRPRGRDVRCFFRPVASCPLLFTLRRSMPTSIVAMEDSLAFASHFGPGTLLCPLVTTTLSILISCDNAVLFVVDDT